MTAQFLTGTAGTGTLPGRLSSVMPGSPQASGGARVKGWGLSGGGEELRGEATPTQPRVVVHSGRAMLSPSMSPF